MVSPAYFDVLGLTPLRGRAFGPGDCQGTPDVAVVSLAAARRFWGDPERAVGASLRLTRDAATPPRVTTVVGVVPDLASPDPQVAPAPHVYLVDAQGPVRQFSVIVRAAGTGPAADGAAEAFAPAVRGVLDGLDRDLAPYQLRTYQAALADERSSDLIIMSLFVAFAVVAILLAATGMYGVMSYVVSQRAPELAVRMALGASAADIGRQMAREAARLTALGVGLGIGGALLLGQAMASLLFGVTPTDPLTHGAVVVLAVVTVAVAVWLPVRRAVRVDPLESLRQA